MVIYFPSLPANGLLFTEKVISIVGSPIFTKGRGSEPAMEQRVFPIVISSKPEIHTISPIDADSTGSFCSPSN